MSIISASLTENTLSLLLEIEAHVHQTRLSRVCPLALALVPNGQHLAPIQFVTLLPRTAQRKTTLTEYDEHVTGSRISHKLLHFLFLEGVSVNRLGRRASAASDAPTDHVCLRRP